ncbi:MAG: 4-hydroxyphenylpyruvate dioxygenase, partial [Rubrivivax sp.]
MAKFTPWDNPMGTDGFEFIEFAAPDPAGLGALFKTMGFTAVARHRHKDVTLYRQGGVNFIINAETDSFAQRFARLHGPSICAIAFRVQDAAHAYQRALELGAWGFDNKAGPMELNIPAIKGIGDSLIYFVDRWQGKGGAKPGAIGNISIYDVDFVPVLDAQGQPVDPNPVGHGLTEIDHLTHNVFRGRMKEWSEFYERFFDFREVRYFDIEGKLTGLKSKAMTSPCGKIRIPINESSDDKSQIAEYLDLYHGEGIQ